MPISTQNVVRTWTQSENLKAGPGHPVADGHETKAPITAFGDQSDPGNGRAGRLPVLRQAGVAPRSARRLFSQSGSISGTEDNSNCV